MFIQCKSTRHNVKVRYNFVDSIETEKVCLATSLPIKSNLDEFINVFPSTNFISPACRLMILPRPQQSTLIHIRMTDLHCCSV